MHRAVSLFTLVVGLLIPAGLSAQARGTTTGAIKDASDAVLPGVTVEASSPVLIEKTRRVVSEGNGQFSIVNLPPGTYKVSFTLTGFCTYNRESLVVSIGVTVTLNITM